MKLSSICADEQLGELVKQHDGDSCIVRPPAQMYFVRKAQVAGDCLVDPRNVARVTLRMWVKGTQESVCGI